MENLVKKENVFQAENVFYSFLVNQSVRFGYSEEKLVCYCDGIKAFLSKYPVVKRNEFLQLLHLYYSELEVCNLFDVKYTLRLFHIFIENREVLDLVFQARTKIKTNLKLNHTFFLNVLDNCVIPKNDLSNFSDKISFVIKTINTLKINNSNFEFYKELIKVICDSNNDIFLTKVQINKKLQFILHCFLNFKKQNESIEKYIQIYKSYSYIVSINFDLQFIKLLDSKLNVNYILDFTVVEINKLYELYKIKPILFEKVKKIQEEEISAFAFLLAVFENYKISIYFLNWFFLYDYILLDKREYQWFQDVLDGKNLIYSENLPFKVTKKVAHIFTNLDNELKFSVTSALIYSAFLNHNVSSDYAIAFVRKISTMNNIDFWIETLRLLYNKGIQINELNEVIDYIRYKVFRRKAYINFKTISLNKLRKDSSEWHDEVYFTKQYRKKNAKFEKCSIETFRYKEKEKEYLILQLLNTKELYKEGLKLRHCVLNYNLDCVENLSAIFSLRIKNNKNKYNPLVTIEVKRGEIVQKRGLFNRNCTEFEDKIIQMWANENNLKIA